MITAIDPGTDQSAILTLSAGKVLSAQLLPNDQLLDLVRASDGTHSLEPVAIEMVACYGMAVGREIFETCVLIGRLLEAYRRRGNATQLIYRRDVKIWLCNSMKAKDSNIRQALIDKYGPPGTKKNPGKTYGISGDMWSALAIADYALNHPPRL